MKLRKTIVVAFVVLCIGVAGATRGIAGPIEDGAEFLQSLANEAIAVLADKSLSLKEREKSLGRIFDRGFHLPTVSRFVLGRHWNSATEEQRLEYQAVFREFIVVSNSKRFSSFAGERVEVTGSRAEGKADVMVISRIVGSDGGDPTRVTWRVRRISGEHKIIDVVVEGVSMLITQRDEFSAVIRMQGGKLEGLIAVLHDKVRSLK